MDTRGAPAILVPVSDSVTIRNTVAYAARHVADAAAETDERPQLHFVVPVAWQGRDLNEDRAAESEALLDRIETWVEEDLDVDDHADLPFDTSTAIIAEDQFLFSPRDYADVILDYARKQELSHIILDPEFNVGARTTLLSPLTAELDMAGDMTYEQAPVERPISGRGLLQRRVDLNTFVVTFALSFGFYQLIGGFAGLFDYATGAITAAIVATVLSGITFERRISPRRALGRIVRWILYVPFLFWEITKANLEVVYIVLHPSLPIDPTMERISPAVPMGLPVTTLANSITLTPGTVTVDVREGKFLVHALTQSARDGLYDGDLERAVRFVFFGREAARIPSLRNRGQQPTREKVAEATAESAESAAPGDSEDSEASTDTAGGEAS
jgi:multicomponent Na+:H+ antiporter subunit E